MRLNLVERIKIIGRDGEFKVEAKVDTGSKRTCIDSTLSRHLGIFPVGRKVRVVTAAIKRPVERSLAKARIELKGETHRVMVSLENRSHMKYKAIIGMDIIRHYNLILIPKEGMK